MQYKNILAVGIAITMGAVFTISGIAQESLPKSPLENQAWIKMGGPVGGVGYDIRVDPSNPDIMYVTDALAGVHKSVDGGISWFSVNEGIEARASESGDSIPVFCLTIDPNDPQIIWVGTQSFTGVYRSQDGGQTWEKRINGIREDDILTIRGVAIEPGNSDVVYIAGEVYGGEFGGAFDKTYGVVYKSVDAGKFWEPIWRGDDLARYVLIHPENHNILYVSTGIFDREAINSDPEGFISGGVGVLKSFDGGETWEQINKGLDNLYIGSLVMHPTNPEILMAGAGHNFYREGGGVYLTEDGGGSWVWKTGEHITSVEFSSANPNIAYAAGQSTFYRSENGGHSWEQISAGYGPPGIQPGFAIDMVVDPRDPDRIFVNNYGGGNFLSEDGGRTWATASSGYSGANLNDVALDYENPGVVFVNGRSGPFVSYNGGKDWVGLNMTGTDLPGITEGANIVPVPGQAPNVIMSSAHWGWTYYRTRADVQMVTDYWDTIAEDDNFFHDQGFQSITFAPNNPNIVYAGWARASVIRWHEELDAEITFSVLRSSDGGRNWEPVPMEGMDNLNVSAIEVLPFESDVIWLATMGKGIYTTRDGGKTAEPQNKGMENTAVVDLALDVSEPSRLYAVTYRDGIYKTDNWGDDWRRVSAGLIPEAIYNTVVVDPARSNVVYVGSLSSGVFVSEDYGETWKQINTGLVNRSVNALAISQDGNTLYAGTQGAGLFRLSIHPQEHFDSVGESYPRFEIGGSHHEPAPEAEIPDESSTATEQPVVKDNEKSNGVNLPCVGSMLPVGLIAILGWTHWRKEIE